MQRLGNTTVILLVFFGSFICVMGRQLASESEGGNLRLFHPHPYYSGFPKRQRPSYAFGLGKRSLDDSGAVASSSYEEQLSPLDSFMEREALLYPYSLGKRARAYGFGLGKRQDRRSKIYSFGLGKRQSPDAPAAVVEDYEDASQTVERRASPQRQFAFGLGKRGDLNSKE